MPSILHVLCAALLLGAIQIDASKLELKSNSLIVKLENWLNDKVLEFKQEMLKAEEEIKTLEKELIDNGIKKISKTIEDTKNDIISWKNEIPVKCYMNAIEDLGKAEKEAVNDFINCKNASKIWEDLRDILNETVNISFELGVYVHDAMEIAEKCQPFGTVKGIECLTQYIWEVVQDVRKGIPDVERFVKNVYALGIDLRKEVEGCLHPQSSIVSNILQKIRTCV